MAYELHPVLMPIDALHAPAVGARLRAMREQREISREQIAAEFRRRAGTKTATNTVARWESTGSLKVQELLELAELLDCDPIWLLLGDRRAVAREGLQSAIDEADREARDRRARGDGPAREQ